jgi:mRNA interferase MazF
MVGKDYVPNRGDLVWIDLNPVLGHELAKIRPALVISPKSYNKKTSLLIACAITSQIKGYPFEVVVDEKNIKGVVLADQIRTLDWQKRKVRFIQKSSPAILSAVVEKISVLIQE